MAISVVQHVGSASVANGTSISVTLTPTAGNTLIAAVNARNGTNGDATGPAGWTEDASVVDNSFATSVWRLSAYAGSGPQTYTWTQVASDTWEVDIYEVSGDLILDQFATNTSSGVQSNPVDSGTTATTTDANEFWLMAGGSTGSGNRTVSGQTSGWTVGDTEDGAGSHPSHLTTCYQVATATGAAHCQFTLSATQVWHGLVATYKAASGGTTVYGQGESDGAGQGIAAAAVYDAGESAGSGAGSVATASVYARAESGGAGSGAASGSLFAHGESAGVGSAASHATVYARGMSSGVGGGVGAGAIFAGGAPSVGAGQGLAEAAVWVAGESDGMGAGGAPLTGVWLWVMGESDGAGTGSAQATATSPTPPTPAGVSIGWAPIGPTGVSVALAPIGPTGVSVALAPIGPTGVSVT